ncbi:hypothetical protein UTI89_C0223 [Escherichia coli UTI89]|uniref:Uncharacterized protein n=1 Tax=Escherichia coli (strain UTI89 / UPEC) TaxID=364106 RepID=Q1RFY5_ECOUT|nr:hypothetical protein UTI89_C0223 [Escherichia coli UTI89]
MAERTGLEPATPCVTGRYSNRLNYRSTEFFYNHRFITGLLLNLMPGSSLLSHGETPHYHRRYGVSLLSSAWGQVGPPRYGRQANSVLSTRPVLTCRFNLYQAENLLSIRQNSFGVVRLSLTVH